ncbi:KptA family-domain-containing protein [Mycena belliarum]|uniref:2'-phosphotransferase n=1 Tax=Mycena belliarum TaxID=1033014 RepID=A0AAD6U7I1_9AGAR|nr:KptA family-domain-containing protein [Mycena belliae]
MIPTLARYRIPPLIPRTPVPPAVRYPFPSHRTKRNHGQDPREVRISRELSYILRHGAKNEGVPIRSDGYADVDVLLRHRMFHGVDFSTLESVVKNDSKQRYHLIYEARPDMTNAWWIRANQGHSMDVSLDLKPLISAKLIPMAVHGTTLRAWEAICKQGISRMSRNHIHLAQGVVGSVTSGMRSSSEVMIYIDVQRAMAADLKFYLSRNGVVLTPGNELGYLKPRFFSRVERVKFSADPIPGWEESEEEGLPREGLPPAPNDRGLLKKERKPSSKEKRLARHKEHAAMIRRLQAPELEII